MSIRNIITGAALAISFALGGIAYQPQPVPETTVLENGPQTLGGCIRLYGSGPEWHVDNDHWIAGIDPTVNPVIDSSGFLTFKTIEKNAIVSISPSPDETLTARGISVGGSNGSQLVRLRFYKEGVGPLNLKNAKHWSYVQGEFSNLWILIVQDGEWVPY